MSTPANRRRAAERIACRTKLSEHLKNTLSLHIHPSEIRLLPNPTDEYRWEYNNNHNHLLGKNLSDLSTNDYVEIITLLRDGEMWAVRSNSTGSDNRAFGPREGEIWLEGELERLKEAYRKLQDENRQLKIYVQFHMQRSRWIHKSLGKAERHSLSALQIMEQVQRTLSPRTSGYESMPK